MFQSFDTLSPADQERLRALRRMKGVALGALLAMAVLFAISFPLQHDVPALAYVRAAAEGGMVGALADWFAVTALFRRPLGLPIPHTALIPRRKDELASSLGDFVETNFLSSHAVRTKLASADVTGKLGAWLAVETNAARVSTEAGAIGAAALRALSDDDVQDLIANLAREHLLDPEWGTPAGVWLGRVVESGAHEPAIDLATENLARWLRGNRAAFDGLMSKRLPSWVPSAVVRLIDGAIYHEALSFMQAVRSNPDHAARGAITRYLTKLADDLQHDPETRARLEDAKSTIFDSPRVQHLAVTAWETTKASLIRELEDERSSLRRRLRDAVQSFGKRLTTDTAIARRGNEWITSSASFFVDRYRHDIASIITDTIERWDPQETTEKIELLVGKDLQFIRLNGTIVGALAGVTIYAVAHAIVG